MQTNSRPLKIAVIGSGIAGLSAAWHLHNTGNQVTVFAGGEHVGGHSETFIARTQSGELVPVDTGFSLYQEYSSPNLVQLLRRLQVPVQEGNMSFGISFADGHDEYAAPNFFARKRNYFSLRHWKLRGEINRFARQAPRLLTSSENPVLGEYLANSHFSVDYVERYLVPLVASLWLLPAEEVLELPARNIIRHLMSHGLLKGQSRGWYTITGGSEQYIKKLITPFAHRIRLVSATRVRRSRAGVLVESEGSFSEFDQVVFACHADEALKLLADPTAQETEVLGAFRFAPNRAVLHQDDSLMPVRDAAWASLNAMSLSPQLADGPVSLSIWVNNVQDIEDNKPLFLSINPFNEPAPELKAWEGKFTSPIPGMKAIQAQGKLPQLQGVNGVWYCGGWCGMGQHEDALTAGLTVAEAMSGVARPWQVKEIATAAFNVWPASGAATSAPAETASAENTTPAEAGKSAEAAA